MKRGKNISRYRRQDVLKVQAAFDVFSREVFGIPPAKFIHVPQPDGTLQLKRFLDCLPSDLVAHVRWLDEVFKRADLAELDFVADFYRETPDQKM